jgi:hypothetical protein
MSDHEFKEVYDKYTTLGSESVKVGLLEDDGPNFRNGANVRFGVEQGGHLEEEYTVFFDTNNRELVVDGEDYSDIKELERQHENGRTVGSLVKGYLEQGRFQGVF